MGDGFLFLFKFFNVDKIAQEISLQLRKLRSETSVIRDMKFTMENYSKML